jgi:periplasmic protein CpxP/Spy
MAKSLPSATHLRFGCSQAAKRRYRQPLPEFGKDTDMSSFTHPIAKTAPVARSVAIAALIGATMLASPLTAARADTTTILLAQAAAPPNPAAAGATETKGETVEQRITNLHAALKITPDEESKWNDVAQAMRENAAAMDKLVAATRTTPPQNMSAVDDLKMYQKFAQAHVDGLKNLMSSFEKLYAAMPDAQKKIADEVFKSSRN